MSEQPSWFIFPALAIMLPLMLWSIEGSGQRFWEALERAAEREEKRKFWEGYIHE